MSRLVVALFCPVACGINTLAFAKPEGLVISGTVQRQVASHCRLGSQVPVQLLNAQGRVLAEKMTVLQSTAPRKDASANYRASYHVHFDAALSHGAVTSRTIYHSQPHPSGSP